jgi:probable HAF family extracellular repeat protein
MKRVSMCALVLRRGSAVVVAASLVFPAAAVAAGGPAPIEIAAGQAAAINDNGQVVGAEYQSDTGWLWQQGVGMTKLFPDPGYGWATVAGINNRAMVVGSSPYYARGKGGTYTTGAFLWTPASGGVPLGTLEGEDYRSTSAADINERAEMAGTRGNGNDFQNLARAVMWTPEGWMVDLGTLPGDARSVSTAINDNGQVVGYSYQNTTAIPGSHAFSWTRDGGMTDLGTLPGAGYSQAFGVNNHGQVVGFSGTCVYPCLVTTAHAFVWTREGGMVDIGTLPGAEGSVAYDINDKGQIVGSSGGRAFIWTQTGGMVELGALPGHEPTSTAVAINEHGQVAGSSGSASGLHDQHAVMWFGDTTPPAARVRLVRGQTISSALRRGIRVQLTLSEPAANDVTLSLSNSGLRLAHRAIDSTGTTTLTLKLERNARTRKALKRLHQVTKTTIKVRTTARDRAGNSSVATTKLVLKRGA